MYEELATPVTYGKNNFKLPSRRLWQNENETPEHDHWKEQRKPDKGQWDRIESPQFLDFSNLPEPGDSFFNTATLTASTPKPHIDNGKLPNFFEDEDTLIASFNNVFLAGTKREPPAEALCTLNNGNEEFKEEYVVHNAICTMEKNGKKEYCAKVKKPQTASVNPFAFDLREKHRQEHKQERINKILEEEKKVRVFRANPVPKFLKARSVPANTNKHNNNDNTTSDRNDNIKSSADEKAQTTNSSEKPVKMNTEILKKPPSSPSLTKKSPGRSKAPSLHTASRAQERKRFDNIIKERETQREQARQMELAALKKQEEREVARLRKQTVHKAQPIRKYKMCAPKAEKRSLTDPMNPLSSKRRRRV